GEKRVFFVILFTSLSGSLVSRITGAVQSVMGLSISAHCPFKLVFENALSNATFQSTQFFPGNFSRSHKCISSGKAITFPICMFNFESLASGISRILFQVSL
ncbi:hypothetical protein, partial [Erwinia persicina]|uniref:hypothetical protein n=1 Tax=Erwinia persicina TaxID=55211 RepID=UPI001A7E293A